mmetsp:Transcript_13997/g.29533  ORF Transcript_13997/g.29533 Transcript_13997/m.29533 type:complete len:303 (-) Transcript_13997:29-937(-)
MKEIIEYAMIGGGEMGEERLFLRGRQLVQGDVVECAFILGGFAIFLPANIAFVVIHVSICVVVLIVVQPSTLSFLSISLLSARPAQYPLQDDIVPLPQLDPQHILLPHLFRHQHPRDLLRRRRQRHRPLSPRQSGRLPGERIAQRRQEEVQRDEALLSVVDVVPSPQAEEVGVPVRGGHQDDLGEFVVRDRGGRRGGRGRGRRPSDGGRTGASPVQILSQGRIDQIVQENVRLFQGPFVAADVGLGDEDVVAAVEEGSQREAEGDGGGLGGVGGAGGRGRRRRGRRGGEEGERIAVARRRRR